MGQNEASVLETAPVQVSTPTGVVSVPPADIIAAPHFSRLKLGDDLLIREGPFKGRRGALVRLATRYAVLDVPNLFRGTIQLSVPLEWICSLPQYFYDQEAEKARLLKDRYGYIERDLSEFQEANGSHFRCKDPSKYDVQIRSNWIWFTGACDDQACQRAGFNVNFAVNMFLVRLPVLLLTREVMHVTQQGKNSMHVYEFIKVLTKKRRKKIRNPRLCYRGYRWRPDDFVEASRSPLEDPRWYSFRRGHLIPATVQYSQVPELGVKILTRNFKNSKKAHLSFRSMCVALPLVPLKWAHLLSITRWGVLGNKFDYDIGPPAPFEMVGPRAQEQLAVISGEEENQ